MLNLRASDSGVLSTLPAANDLPDFQFSEPHFVPSRSGSFLGNIGEDLAIPGDDVFLEDGEDEELANDNDVIFPKAKEGDEGEAISTCRRDA